MKLFSAPIRIIVCFLLSTSWATAEELKIGIIMPLTGPAASMGESVRGVLQVARLGFKTISATPSARFRLTLSCAAKACTFSTWSAAGWQ